jgi:hypothetical protein
MALAVSSPGRLADGLPPSRTELYRASLYRVAIYWRAWLHSLRKLFIF